MEVFLSVVVSEGKKKVQSHKRESRQP